MYRRAVVHIAFLALCSWPAGAAFGHGAEVGQEAFVDRVTPAVRGLRIVLSRSVAPLAMLRNRTGRSVEVLDDAGRAYLRIGPDRVEGDAASIAFAASRTPLALPAGSRGATEQRWIVLSEGAEWSWYDARLRPPSGRTPYRWGLRLRAGGREVTVTGRTVRLGGHGHFVTALDDSPAGLEAKLFDGRVPVLWVTNRTGRVLEIPGADGEPFARVGPDGVSVNRRSPSAYLASTAGVRPPPPDADPTAPPEWEGRDQRPTFAWLEYRARLPEEGAAPGGLGTRKRTVLRWRVPVRLGEETVAFAGRVEWVPAPGAEASRMPTWMWVLGAAAAVVLAAAMVASRRRGAR